MKLGLRGSLRRMRKGCSAKRVEKKE